MAEGTKRSENGGGTRLKKQPMDFVAPKKNTKTKAAPVAKVAPVLSAKDAINARAKATKADMPTMGSAKELINASAVGGSGRASKSAANLHHSSLQKNLESTRTSASALLKMAKASKPVAPPDLTSHADPLAKTAPIVAARLGSSVQNTTVKPVVRTSLRLGSSARPAEEAQTIMPSHSRMVRHARPVMSSDEELIQAFESSLSQSSSSDLLENAIQSAQGSPAIEASSSRSLARMVQATHAGDLGRPALIEDNARVAGRKTARKTSRSLSIGAKSSAQTSDEVYNAASLDLIETGEIIESLKAESNQEPLETPKTRISTKQASGAKTMTNKAVISKTPTAPQRRARMSDITPAAQNGMKAAVRGARAHDKIAKKITEAEAIPVKLGAKAAISQAVGMPSSTVKVPSANDNSLKVNFGPAKTKTAAPKKTQPLRFSEQTRSSKANEKVGSAASINAKRSLRDIFKGTRDVIKRVQKGSPTNPGETTAQATDFASKPTPFAKTPTKKPQPNHNAINIYASDFVKKKAQSTGDSVALGLGIVENYGSESVDRRANGSMPATYELDHSSFATSEAFGREVGDVGLGAKSAEGKRSKSTIKPQRNNFADANVSYSDLTQEKKNDLHDYFAESVAELGADARGREQARDNNLGGDELRKVVQPADRSGAYSGSAPGRSDLTSNVRTQARSGVAPAVRPSIDYYSPDYYDPPKKENRLASSAETEESILASLAKAGGIEEDLETAFAETNFKSNPPANAKPDNRYALGPDSPFLLKTANVEKRPLSDNSTTPPSRTINRGVTAKVEPADRKKSNKKAKAAKSRKPSPRDSGSRPTVIVPATHRSKTPLFCLVIFTIFLGVIAGATFYLCFFQ